MRLYVFVTCLIPRAVTATRPLPGANIQTCRYAAAWRYAPFLLWKFDVGLSRSYAALNCGCCFDTPGCDRYAAVARG